MGTDFSLKNALAETIEPGSRAHGKTANYMLGMKRKKKISWGRQDKEGRNVLANEMNYLAD